MSETKWAEISQQYSTDYSRLVDEYKRVKKENAELRAKLDAWEKQRPVAFIYQATTEAYLAFDDLRNAAITIPDDDVIPLFAKPKEA